MRHFKDEISSIKEASSIYKSLKTVKFDSLPKADADDFVSSEYKQWCIDNFNRTDKIESEESKEGIGYFSLTPNLFRITSENL